MITTTFNTSRLYTAEGQVVTAQFDRDTMTVTFKDHSRMIAGRFTIETKIPDRINETNLPGIVMNRYDHNLYNNIGFWEGPERQDTVATYRI